MIKSQNQKPSFINVGPGRCATTWMFEILKAHPEITMAMVKETEFFNSNFQKGVTWYENHFPPSANRAIGEISNAYYVDPAVPDRIRDYAPEMKIIFNLRRPKDLLQSFYGFALRRGLRFSSTAEALASPIGKIMGSGYEYRAKHHQLSLGDKVSLLDSVLLTQFIKLFQLTFPPTQIHFFVYERLKHEGAQALRDIYQFLDVDSDFVPDLAGQVINEAIVPKSKWIARLATKISFSLRRIGAYQLLGSLHRSKLIKRLFYAKAAGPKPIDATLSLDQKTLDLLNAEELRLIQLVPELEKWWGPSVNSPVGVSV